MDHKTLGVADVRKMAPQLERIDKAASRLAAAAQTERKDRTELRFAHPRDFRPSAQVTGYRARVGHMPFHAQGQRLQTEEQQPCIHRRHLRADVAQNFGARSHEERVLAERFGENLLMVTRAGLGEQWKAAVLPWKLPRLYQHAADRRAVAVDELRCRMHDNVRAMLDRAAEIGSRERIVDDQRDARVVRECCERAQIGNDARRISDGLHEDQPRLRPNCGAHRAEIVGGYERRLDSHSLDRYGKLRHRTAVDVLRTNEMVAGLREREHHAELRRKPAGESDAAEAALQTRHPFFECSDRGIANTAVDVPVTAQRKELRSLLG